MYNPRKAAQVIAYLALKTPKRSLEVIRAVKLVYLSDRRSLQLWGAPILDECRVSMPHGPVNSETYSHICGEYDLSRCGWLAFLEAREHNTVAVAAGVTSAFLDELSDADIQALDDTWARFGHFGPWELRDWTHNSANVPEWEDPHGSSSPIPLRRMMVAVGVPNADEQAELLEDHREIDALFASLS
jgi:uncharacterized phage-associated protein